jgi:hypothetical protein
LIYIHVYEWFKFQQLDIIIIRLKNVNVVLEDCFSLLISSIMGMMNKSSSSHWHFLNHEIVDKSDKNQAKKSSCEETKYKNFFFQVFEN